MSEFNERAQDLHDTQTEVDDCRRRIAEDHYLFTTMLSRFGYETKNVEAALEIMFGQKFRDECGRIAKKRGPHNVRYVCGKFHENNEQPPFLRPYFGILSRA